MRKNKIKVILSKNERILLIIIVSFCIIHIGVVFNILVIKTNHGKMPFLSDYEYADDQYFSFNETNPNFWVLSDIIPIGNKVRASIGDFMIGFGTLGVIFFVSIFIHKKRKDRNI